MSTFDDETAVTEITIQPDGRIYVFGTSAGVLEVLCDLQPRDETLRQRLAGHLDRDVENLGNEPGEQPA